MWVFTVNNHNMITFNPPTSLLGTHDEFEAFSHTISASSTLSLLSFNVSFLSANYETTLTPVDASSTRIDGPAIDVFPPDELVYIPFCQTNLASIPKWSLLPAQIDSMIKFVAPGFSFVQSLLEPLSGSPPAIPNIVTSKPTLSGEVGEKFVFIKFDPEQFGGSPECIPQTWDDNGATIAVCDGDVTEVEIISTGSPLIADWEKINPTGDTSSTSILLEATASDGDGPDSMIYEVVIEGDFDTWRARLLGALTRETPCV